jgi:hypothetical protein
MSRRKRFAAPFGASAFFLAVLVALVGLVGRAGAVDPAVTQHAVEYLKSQQNPGTTPATGSGAWDSSPAVEFVTSEAVLAIAEQAQSGTTWSTSQALTAVQQAQNPDGVDALPFLDLVAGGALSPGKAAKLILLVAKPLGLDPTAFDPAGNGSPVDLVNAVGSPNPDGSFGPPGAFNQTLYASLALELVNGSVPVQTVQYIRNAQKPSNGGWSFDADPGATTDADTDTTSFAVQALLAGGVAPSDPAVRNGLVYFASQQNTDGSWSAFGNVSAESTSRAILAISASGYDPNSSCWRDTVAPTKAGTPYGLPDTALAGLQHPGGSISGPGVFSATFATAQAVQGLERNWLPVTHAAAQTCATVLGPGTSPITVAGAEAAGAATPVAAQPRFTG